MDDKVINVRKDWPCANQDCAKNLGTVINGELVIELSATANVNTNGANIELTCSQCGRVKTWYAKEAAIFKAYRDYERRGVARAIQELGAR